MKRLFLFLLSVTAWCQPTAHMRVLGTTTDGVWTPNPSRSRSSFTVYGNFPRDLYGPLDTRLAGQSCNVGPCIWGHADSDSLAIPFHPPAGFQVRVLKIKGDLISFAKTLDDDPPIPANRNAAVLVGFSTSTPTAAPQCDYCAAGTIIYAQDALHGGEARRARLSYNFSDEWIYLGSDNVLVVKLASFLNNTGYPIHLEATFRITAQFIKDPQ